MLISLRGGVFVFTNWWDTRKLYKVISHYDGFNWEYDEDGKRRKGSEVIKRVKVKDNIGNIVRIDSEGIFVMESIPIEHEA